MECGCKVITGDYNKAGKHYAEHSVEFCPKHAAADAMLEALKEIAEASSPYRLTARKAIALAEPNDPQES